VLRRAVSDRLHGHKATVFLSGGVDSTTIAAVAAQSSADLLAVTINYDTGHAPGEVEVAREVAQRLGLRHEVVRGDTYSALDAEMRGDVSALPVDEPTLSDWRASLAHAARHSTLAIYGEDGDALFAPLGGGALVRHQGIWSAAIESVRYASGEGRLPHWGVGLRTAIRRTRTPDAVSTVVPPWLTRHALALASSPEDDRLFGQTAQPLVVPESYAPFVRRVLAAVPCDFAHSISPETTKVPVAITLPLLDSHVVRFVQSVPSIPWRQQKTLARRAFHGILPDAVLRRPKTPVAGFFESLVSSSRQQRELTVLPDSLPPLLREWVDGVAWRRTVEQGTTGEVMSAWRVLMLSAWLQQHR
jgi:asparagine synthase (glutamine-hydrolysing)